MNASSLMLRILPAGAALILHLCAHAAVVTYPAPSGETLSADYQVSADGQPVDVYTARTLDPPFAGKEWDFGGPYAFANFDVSGRVEVRITSKRSLSNVVVRPTSEGMKVQVKDAHTLVLTLPGPRQLSIEPEGRRGPLLLFANPMEPTPPKPDAPGVIHFGPGIHKPGRIVVTNGQTLYLAGGAVVKGGILALGENIRIMGRGILDGSDWEWRKGPTPHVISIRGTNVEVSGITIRGASHWTIVPLASRQVTIRHVKLCNSRVQNDDGINPCNSEDVLIEDCFVRSDDDCVAIKGLAFLNDPPRPVRNIIVRRCVFWCDRARIFLLGHESQASAMEDILFDDCDILHYTMTPFLLEPGEDMPLRRVRFTNFRIHGEGQREFITLRPTVNQYMKVKVPGSISEVTFTNVVVSGRKSGPARVVVQGADAAHTVRQVTFDRVVRYGQLLEASGSNVSVGPFTRDILFKPTEP